MKNQNSIYLQPLRGNITEKKKAELDALTIAVLDAQHTVEQFQAIVTSLTEKANNFQGFLAVAENNRTMALNNRNLLDELVQNAIDLQKNSGIAFNEMVNADVKTKTLSGSIKLMMDKLIYSAEVINKLSNVVIRKKALNPLISDELVSMIATAGKDANNAVALTLVALKSTFSAEASNMESEAAAMLEYSQAIDLYSALTGVDANGVAEKDQDKSLKSLLYTAYEKTKQDYEHAHSASIIATKQLNQAKADLDKAQIKLKSLQSGLAAGNAAALAS